MEVTIQSIHFDADQKLLDQVHTKLEKLTRFDAALPEAHVYLKLDADRGGFHEKVVEIKLIKPGKTIVSKAENGTFEDALDEAVEAALVQVKKLKDKEK
jgi:putative sigma-54 modulation protein